MSGSVDVLVAAASGVLTSRLVRGERGRAAAPAGLLLAGRRKTSHGLLLAFVVVLGPETVVSLRVRGISMAVPKLSVVCPFSRASLRRFLKLYHSTPKTRPYDGTFCCTRRLLLPLAREAP